MNIQPKPPAIRKRANGKLATTTYVGEVVDAVTNPPFSPRFGNSSDPLGPGFAFIGTIIDKGPRDEADFTDNRYWITPQYIRAGMVVDRALTTEDGRLFDAKAIPATDLSGQLQLSGDSAPGSHTRIVGEYVFVHAVVNASGKSCYVFIGGGGDSVKAIKITGAALISGQHNRYQYTWSEQRYLTTGRWEDVPNGLTQNDPQNGGYAYNTCEANNDDVGLQGNSIDLATLPAGFELQPVQGSPVVFARRIPSCDGHNPAWLFQYENAVQGECP